MRPNVWAEPALPRTFVWAWERPEDLRRLDARVTGVAFLARTIQVIGGGVSDRPRIQPLQITPGTAIVAVVRLETGREPAPIGPAAVSAIAAAIAREARPGVRAIQIDFDARESERDVYRALVRDVRARIPAGVGLSITALASWCLDDPWIADLPVDDAVPMLFRMGAEGAAIRAHLDGGGDFRLGLCRNSLGLSTDEPVARVPAGRRVYLFHPTPWTAAVLAQLRPGHP